MPTFAVKEAVQNCIKIVKIGRQEIPNSIDN